MPDRLLDDARATDPVERLLEESWQARGRRMSRRELTVEGIATALFLGAAVPMAAAGFARHAVDLRLVALLVTLYAVVARVVKFPLGAGYVVPSYVVLVPMLLLLPPGTVPLLAALGLVLGAAARWLFGHAEPERVIFSVPDAWHAVGTAAVLMAAGHPHSGWALGAVYAGAFAAGCVFDLVSASARESLAMGIAPELQLRVAAVVWVVDACLAPLGLLVAHAARTAPADALLILPATVLLLLLVRDRNARIEEAQRRLELVARERTRLQRAVRRLGDAFAAKLQLDALLEILLRGCIEAVDADGGRLTFTGAGAPADIVVESSDPTQGAGELVVPFDFMLEGDLVEARLVLRRGSRQFAPDEREVVADLVARARLAAVEIVANDTLRAQATTDPLTRLGNRRRLATDLATALAGASLERPVTLMLFDLDGFKSYNDTFGHPAGDALLARLGRKLATAVAEHGTAYRLGGDEFCALVSAPPSELTGIVSVAAEALEEHGERFSIGASYGAVVLPHEADNADYAIQLADQRMYACKASRSSASADQARDVLLEIMQARQPGLHDHAGEVAELTSRVGRRLGMTAEELDELSRAAQLHDVGKVGIPDAILDKPAALNDEEWDFMRQHTVLGERILSAAPALRPVALLVRASHERWDGGGYPDGLAGAEIPLGARVIAVCDAYDAMTAERCYRTELSHADACDELRREAGRQFDPAVVEAFLAEVDERRRRPRTPRAVERDEQRRRRIDEVTAQLEATFAQHGIVA